MTIPSTTRPPFAMLGLTTDPRAMREDWSDGNARGLAYAAVGAWSDAALAFASAADAAEAQSDVASHEALALVLNNLAQASFRAGRVEDGIRHAQRACSLRAALVGEDAIAVARARADLAVMLGSVGRADEGLGLMRRAIAGIERSAGDEDLRLSTVLENAARLAMALGQPATAEPHLIRLHALLAAHDLPTDAADALLARVAKYRARDLQLVADDDEPLRDAVQETERLLRTTPRGTRAITPSAVMPVVDAAEPEHVVVVAATELPGVAGLEFDLVDDSVALPDHDASDHDAVEEIEAVSESWQPTDQHAKVPQVSVTDDVFGNATFDLVDETAATSESAGKTNETVSPPLSSSDVLGFVVEYGTPQEPIVPTRTTPRGSPIVVPSPASSQKAVSPRDGSSRADGTAANNRDTRAPRLTVQHTDDLERVRRPRRPNIRWGRASAPQSSRGLLIASVVTTAIAGSIGWLVWSAL